MKRCLLLGKKKREKVLYLPRKERAYRTLRLSALASHHHHLHTTTAAKSLQSCPTLCDPIDGSPQGSPVPGILQARTLEWVATAFSNAGK